MQYSYMTFDTREEARAWLAAGGYGPGHVPNVPGVWANGTHTVQAYKNSVGTWTVAKYEKPDPAKYITE